MNRETSNGFPRLLADAARNLALHRKRTLAIAASLACGIAALCLIGGYYQYTYWGLGQSLVHSKYAHIQLYQKGYERTRDIDPFEDSIKRRDELMRILSGDPDIDIAAPRSLAFATACNAETGKSAVVEVRGVDPSTESAIFTFVTSKRGSWLTAKDGDKCQIAPALAKDLGVSLDGTLTVSAAMADGQYNALGFTVKTLAGSYSQEFDALALTVPVGAFEELFGTAEIQEIVLLLKDGVAPERKIKELEKTLAAKGFDLEYRLWYEQAAYFRQVLSYFQGYYRVVLLLAALLAFFVSATTISMSLNERMREFGTRLSLGESRFRLVASLSAEALLSGLAGLCAGAVLSFALGFSINRAGGIPMPAAPGLTTSLRINILYSPQGARLSVLLALLVPPASLVLPAYKIMKSSVVYLLNKGRS